MGDKYGVALQQGGVLNTGDTANAVGSIEPDAGATVRPRIYDLVFGQGGTAADNTVRYELQRFTASGAGNAAGNEVALDPGAPSADAITLEEFTTVSTVAANTELLDIVLNQRATFRWVAAPGGEIIIPATADEGIVIDVNSSGYTGLAVVTLHWEE